MSPIHPQFLEKLVLTLKDRVGLAGQVVELIHAWPEGSISHLEASGFDKRESPVAREVIQTLIDTGVLEGTTDDWKRNASACTAALATALQAAAVTRRVVLAEQAPLVAATLPPGTCSLGTALPTLGLEHVLIETTQSAFMETARAASATLLVITPFLNENGAYWIRDIFSESTALERILIIREWGKVEDDLRPILPNLIEMGVRVFDYFLHHGDGYETFHAKAVIADDVQAYVGSANFLNYRKNSVELGVVVRGRSARTVRFIGNAIRNISKEVHITSMVP